MLHASERTFGRRDTVSLLVCLCLSLVGLLGPASWGAAVATTLRDTVLSPLVWLQVRAEEGRTSRARFRALSVERDSAAAAALLLPAVVAENRQLRSLIGLRTRLQTPYIPAEVLHQSGPTDGRMLLVSAGRGDSVRPFDPVVSSEGLIGVVASVDNEHATVMTWAHSDFRVSASTVDGRIYGMVAASPTGSAAEATLEFRSTSYRDTLAVGTPVISSGLGGVYPKGVPVGTIVGVAREQAGWERVYWLRPAASPSEVSHVMILRAPTATPLNAAFPGDSMLAAVRADSARRLRAADSLLRVRIADSVLRVLRDSLRASAAGAGAAAAPVPVAPPRPAPARPPADTVRAPARRDTAP